MKLIRKTKKGFTLVELIVVIAIVAILAAVSVVSYIAFINSANESADIQLVKQLNTCLQADEALSGTRATPTDMLQVMEDNGFIIENLTKTKSGYDIVWDQGHNRFALLKGEEAIYSESSFVNQNNKQRSKITKLVDNESEALAATGLHYAVYLTKEFGDLNNITLKGGIDVGSNNVNSIIYENDEAQDVVIRSNSFSTNITINAQFDEVDHYGKARSINIKAIKGASYDEFGEIYEEIKVQSGNVNVKAGADVYAVTLANKESGNTAPTAPTVTVEGQASVDYLVVDTTTEGSHATINNGANVENAGKGENAGSGNVNDLFTNNSEEVEIETEVVEVPEFLKIELTTNKGINELTELAGFIDNENKIVNIKNVEFFAAADKILSVGNSNGTLYANYVVTFDHCIFDFVALNISVCSGTDFTINKCSFAKYTSYALNFGVSGYGKITITNSSFNTGRGILARTPSAGKDVLIDGCTFNLLSNTGTDKARAIQIATYNYYFAKNTDSASLDYYHTINGAFSGAHGDVLNGKISITNNTFVKASYGIYIYEAQSGGGFTYGNVASDVKLFAELTGNKFEDECIFKYGCSDIGDSRSYTDKGYNTGLIASECGKKANTLSKRALIENYEAINYWDQMRALLELESVIK